MKQTLSLAALVAALIFFSCKKTKDDPPAPEPTYHLNVSATVVQSPAAAGTTTKLGIEANAAWTISVPRHCRLDRSK